MSNELKWPTPTIQRFEIPAGEDLRPFMPSMAHCKSEVVAQEALILKITSYTEEEEKSIAENWTKVWENRGIERRRIAKLRQKRHQKKRLEKLALKRLQRWQRLRI